MGAGGRGGEAAVRLLDAEELHVVGEVGAVGGYWRVLVVAMRASETSRDQAKAALRPGIVKDGSA